MKERKRDSISPSKSSLWRILSALSTLSNMHHIIFFVHKSRLSPSNNRSIDKRLRYIPLNPPCNLQFIPIPPRNLRHHILNGRPCIGPIPLLSIVNQRRGHSPFSNQS